MNVSIEIELEITLKYLLQDRTMSQALAQTALCPDAKNYIDTGEYEDLFKKAMEQLNSIWTKTYYAEMLVTVTDIDSLIDLVADERKRIKPTLEDQKDGYLF